MKLTQSRARHPLLTLLAMLFLLQAPRGTAADVQPGYEFSGAPKAEFLLSDFRSYASRKFWLRRPQQGQTAIPLFCDSADAPSGKDCPRDKFSVSTDESFTIEDVAVAKPEPGLSWFKIRFDKDKKAAYLSLQDFSQHRYNEGRVSAALFGIDYALANSGWIFDDYPPKILDQRRTQFAANNDPKRAQEKLESERITRLKLLYAGMTAQQVLNSSWGRPNAVSTTVFGSRRLEQWDYGSGIVLYFENERLQRIEPHR